MRHFIKAIVIPIFLIFSITSCHKNDVNMDDEFEYHAHIMSPDASAKKMGETLSISVNFESHTGNTVHHINVNITEKGSNTAIYNQPTEAHVHDATGEHLFTDTLVLSVQNGFLAGKTYVLTAKVWAHEDGVAEESESVEFTVTN